MCYSKTVVILHCLFVNVVCIHLIVSLQYGSIVVGAVAEGVRSLTKAKTQQPQLSELARRSVDEDWSVWSLHGGLETLVEKLAEAAAGAGVELLLGAPCTALEPAGAEGIVVRSGTRELIASHVVSALPASQLAALLHPTHPTLAALLHSIPSVDVGLVNMVHFTSLTLNYQ